MSESFRCPRPDTNCPTAEICQAINEPLRQAIPTIRQRVGGIAWKRARAQLETELTAQASLRGADFTPSFDEEGNATVCPRDILDDGLAERVGKHNAIVTLSSLTEMCVENAVNYLNFQRGNKS